MLFCIYHTTYAQYTCFILGMGMHFYLCKEIIIHEIKYFINFVQRLFSEKNINPFRIVITPGNYYKNVHAVFLMAYLL